MLYDEFKEILSENKITMMNFSELTDISYRTVSKWGKDGRSIPKWVKSWLDLYIENKQLKDFNNSNNNDCEEYKKALAKALLENMTKEK